MFAGPGWYKTRGGEKVWINGLNAEGELTGNPTAENPKGIWHSNGNCDHTEKECQDDIVSLWPIEKPVRVKVETEDDGA
jgi:hypothetical protein